MSSSQATDVMEDNWSPEKPATKYIQELCDEIRNDLEDEVGRKLVVFKAISYIENKMCSTSHYVVKIHDIGDVYVHAQIRTTFIDAVETKPSLEGFQDNKKKRDPIVPIRP